MVDVKFDYDVECPNCHHKFTVEVERDIEFEPMVNEGYY